MRTVAPASALGSETVGAKLARCGGSTTGFDYLRIGLAICVLLWHSLETSYADGTSIRVWHEARGVISLILPMFFALSGFLVCGSLVRTRSIVVFMSHRFLRLIPALAVEIILSSLILGPLMTALPLTEYFSGNQFRLYFLNIIGFIHYQLPGVFLHNPNVSTVNKSLWTIPYELECYLALIAISITGLAKRRMTLTLLVTMTCIAVQGLVDYQNSAVLQGTGPPGRLLLLSFLSGVSLHLWKDKIILHRLWLAASLIATITLLSFSRVMFLAAFPAAYITVYLGMTTPRHIPILMDGDYSYGLYLFAYPLQQTYSALFPGARHWWLNATFALVFGLAYAFFSWNVIEKKVLSHRRLVTSFIEGWLPGSRPSPTHTA